MNRFLVLFSVAALLPGTSYSQEKLTVVPADSSVFSGLDLQAVGDLFTQLQTLEDFERALNDTTKGVNNLDLDGDGRVDFIRVVDEVAEDVHLIILQVPIDSVEYQDVATIEIEKKGDDSAA